MALFIASRALNPIIYKMTILKENAQGTKNAEIFKLTAPYNNPYQGNYPRVLFVCSAGLLRSATGATVGSRMGYNTRNCGTEHYALIPLSANLIAWAEKIYFVNEYNLLSAIETFEHNPEILDMLEAKSVTLDLEDKYDYMSPTLVNIFTELLT